MAEEITASASLSVDNGIVSSKLAKVGLSVDLAGSDFTHQSQNAATGEAALDLGKITTPGWFLGINRSTTAAEIIEIRTQTGAAYDTIKIEPGEFACFRFGSNATAPYIISASGTPTLEYLLVED